MIIIITDVDEARELLGLSTERHPTIIRPQTSGPCVHIDSADDDDPDVVRALGLACRHPDGTCPHLDNSDVLCPVKDACSAMSEVARMRDACEAEKAEQDADMAAEEVVYETKTPEFVEPEPEEAPVYTTPAGPTGRAPAPGKEWTAEEDAAIRDAATPAESIALYRSAVPVSGRSDAAIRMRWYRKIRPGLCEAPDPLPDFAGDTIPVTQCEEPAMDGMMCDRPLTPVPETLPETQERESTHHPWIGMHVRVLDPLDLANRTGTVVQYDPDSPEMLVALDNSLDRIWLPPESLLLIGAGEGSL